MSGSSLPAKASPHALPPHAPLAGLLSYLVPGLGQIYQRRTGKGLLFLISIYGLFFYGSWLGSWKNVYLPDTARGNNPWNLPNAAANLYNRPQFAGQFWVGIAAWPAIWQYNNWPLPFEKVSPFVHSFQRTPDEDVLNRLQASGDKTWDLAWVFTVIAGVLNVMVIYDAVAGPAFHVSDEVKQPPREAAA